MPDWFLEPLTLITRFDIYGSIMEECRPPYAQHEDCFGCDFLKKVSASNACMCLVQDRNVFHFLSTESKLLISSSFVQLIFYQEKLFGLCFNRPLASFVYIFWELFLLEVIYDVLSPIGINLHLEQRGIRWRRMDATFGT